MNHLSSGKLKRPLGSLHFLNGLSVAGWRDCRNIESFASQMIHSNHKPTWSRDVMRRRGPPLNQKGFQVAMETKWGENHQAKLHTQKKAWLVSRCLCKRKQCSLFRRAGSCAAEGQLKCVISRERSVCFTNELKATKEVGGRDKKRWKLLWTFSQHTAQPSSTHTFSLSPEFNSNYRNWTIYYLASNGKMCSVDVIGKTWWEQFLNWRKRFWGEKFFLFSDGCVFPKMVLWCRRANNKINPWSNYFCLGG